MARPERPDPNALPTKREVVVVKLGGATLAEEHDTLTGVADLRDRFSVALVHGGGKRLTEWLGRLGIETSFEGGRRVTDDAALEVATAVLGGLVNTEIVAALESVGVPAVGLTGIDGSLLRGTRVPQLGRVASVSGTDITLLRTLLGNGHVPVIAPLALDEHGVMCNVNADEVAAALAGALGARLLLLTDTDGVHDVDGERIPRLAEPAAQSLIESGAISGGMLPKVRGALDALHVGATDVVIADGRAPGALARALDSTDFGTRITLRDPRP
jgi:acetylglutamate kinase